MASYEVTLGLGATAIALFMKWRSDQFRSETFDTHPALLRSQTVTAETRQRGEWAIVRNRATPFNSKNIPQFVSNVHESIAKAFDSGSLTAEFGDSIFIGQGLVALNVAQSPVGVFVENSKDAILVDLAGILYGFATVWIDEEEPSQLLSEVINQVDMTVAVTSPQSLGSLLDAASKHPKLTTIVTTASAGISQQDNDRAAALKIKLISFETLKSIGKEKSVDRVKPELSDLYSIVYENEQNGGIKGTEITYLNTSASVSAVYMTFPQHAKISSEDLYMSILPVSSIFERCLIHAVLIAGGKVAFSSEDTLMKDLVAHAPTLMRTTSPILSDFANAIESHADAKSWAVTQAKAAKLTELEEGRCWKGTFWDRFLTDIQSKTFGGRLRCIWNSCEEAATDAGILETIRSVLGTQVIDTFGMTEISGMAFATVYGDYQPGNHVGVPSVNLEYKLVNAASKEYTITDEPNPRGEIWFRGPGVSKAYHKDAAKMARCVTEEGGWFKSNVYGQIFPNGTLGLI
ncbi:hypothetical protein BJ741DRAFT_630467 [Chytriomyces cf. hyalinus JEL632]|nr:hypothetical protein BJ741DRAFT_630467 [Chytriomyces cf. hyalinus JEL632]